MNEEIEEKRRRIDEIDRKLAKLLARRTGYAVEIGRIKKRENLKIYDPEREETVIRNAKAVTQGELSEGAIQRLFERIIDETRRAERWHSEEKESAGGEPKKEKS